MTTFEQSLAGFTPVSAPRITDAELSARIAGLQKQLRQTGTKAVWLDASSSLQYYTGLSIGLSERVHGAIVPAEGGLTYVSPHFEVPKLETMMRLAGDILPWDEHEDPCAMIGARVQALGAPGKGLAIDPATPFRFAAKLIPAMEGAVIPAQPMIAAQRQVKSATEIAVIQAAMTASHRVQKAVHDGLRAGMSTTEVCDFIDEAHRRLGLAPLFVAVQFGEATAYPHGVPEPQILAEGDMVLVDLGGILTDGYRSDITRTYVFGTPTARQRTLWTAERDAHDAAFAAAKLGAPCEAVDLAARASLEAAGFGPGYDVPGLPHRTGHGLGLDIHEDPFMLMGNKTPLEPGMVFSIEPMLCVYGECGVRIEDIVWMGEDGAHWFCPTSDSLDAPF
ncbi:M24 family metallopeptidase [Paenirhodobacter enshiensis]|uniref:M24 family metallopeptidase n=1 Tax=Paenirhodobacter enshiensis TaxID=1105367 RepID=UPI0035B3D657